METDATHAMTHSLLGHNTFGIDVACRNFVEIDSAEQAQDACPAITGPCLIVGKGANLLFTKDYDGTVVHSRILGIEAERQGDHIIVSAGSGEDWDGFVERCVDEGWYGLENLSLIPGEVGASAVQNIGAYGAEAKDYIHAIEAVRMSDGQPVAISPADCHYAYRYSRFKDEWRGQYFITRVSFRLQPTFTPRLEYAGIRRHLDAQGIGNPTARQLRQAIIDIRRAKLPDPDELGNAGSFFTNPVVGRDIYRQLLEQYPDMPHYDIDEDRVKIPAAWLIEQCGWKGQRLGQAGVHHRQPLVLVNLGGAKGSEILALSQAIQKDVSCKFGIHLTPEVNIL